MIRQPQLLTQGGALCLIRRSPGKIHSVFHDDILTGIPQTPEVLPGTVADHPYLVTGGNIIHQQPDGCLLEELAGQGPPDIDIKLCVVGKHHRHIQPLPQSSGDHSGYHRAMGMDDVRGTVGQRIHGSGAEGISCPVTDNFCCVNTGIPYHRKSIVVRSARVIRYTHYYTAKLPVNDAGIVEHSICHTINDRRK